MPGVAIVDARGCVRSWNAGAERITGWAAGKILGRPFPSACLDPNGTACEAFLAGLAACAPEGFAASVRGPDGSAIAVHAGTAPVIGSDCFTVVLTPQSVQQAPAGLAHAANSDGAMAPFPQANPNPVLRMTRAGEVVYANPAARQLLDAWEPEAGPHPREQLREAVESAIVDGERRSVEIAWAGGRVFSFDCVPLPGRETANLYGQDITERKRAQEEIARERRSLQAILEAVSVGMLLVDDTGAVRHVNDTVAQWVDADLRSRWGGQPGDVLGCVHVTGQPGECGHTRHCTSCPLRNTFEGVLRTRRSIRGVETQLSVSHDGIVNRLWLEINADPLELDGKPHVVMALNNITEHKRTEDALRASEERYRSLFNEMTEGFALHSIILDDEGNPCDYRFLDVNPAFEQLTGLKREDVVGRTLKEVLPANDPIWVREFGKVALTGEPVHIDNYAPPLQRHFDVFAYRPAPGQFAAVFTDVTDLKRAEEALKEASGRLKYHVENSPLAVVEFDREFRITRWSEEAERVFGWSADEVLGKGMTDLPWIHPGDRDKVSAIASAMTSGERLRNVHPNRNVRKDGKVIWCVWYNSALLGEDGAPVSILSQVLDVTEREEAQAAQKRLLAELETERENLRRALQDLAESREQYRTMGEAIPYGVWRTNPEGGAEYVSQSFLDLLEMTEDEMKEFGWTHRLPPDEVAPMLRKWLHCCQTGEPWDSEHRILGPDGRYHAVLTRGLPVRNEQGEITSWVGINLNIDDRKATEEALRESEARFRMLADNISQFAWMADAAGSVFWFNQRWYDYTGLTPEDMDHRSRERIHHPDHQQRVAEHFGRSIAAGEPWEDVFPIRGKDGQYRWFLSLALPIRDESGAIIRWFGTNTDITEHMALEEELRVRAERLAATDRAKDEFLAMLAHELRNPLGAIGNAAALIETQVQSHPLLRKPVDILNRQVKHTARLVDDLLDVSRITQGRMELRTETLDLNAVVARAAEAGRLQMEAQRHDFTVSVPDQPLWMEGDSVRLEQIVGNLLSNAAKYTEPGGRIRLTLVREGGDAVVRVRDNGHGIASEMLPRVFDLFAQEDRSLARSMGGLGIGLTLVRKLVEMHAGTVEAQSEGPGRGSEFAVRLPLVPALPDAARHARPKAAEPPALSRRVLLVDDSVDAAMALGDILECWGHTVHIVHDGAAALEAVSRWEPEVVLLDIGLPAMDGYQVARRLRIKHGSASPRLVALTGYGQAEDRRRAREAGFDHHMVKPVDTERLQKLLSEA